MVRKGRLLFEKQPWDAALLKRFREFDEETPVLFLTARDADSDRVDGLGEEADDYLGKPLAFEELLAGVRALWRRSRSAFRHRASA